MPTNWSLSHTAHCTVHPRSPPPPGVLGDKQTAHTQPMSCAAYPPPAYTYPRFARTWGTLPDHTAEHHWHHYHHHQYLSFFANSKSSNTTDGFTVASTIAHISGAEKKSPLE